jgi:hypothetical protein
MMTLCIRCCLAIRVLDQGPEVDFLVGEKSDFWPVRYPCPECGRNTKPVSEDIPPDLHRKLQIMDLTAKEAFIAYSGVGLPKQRKFSGEELETKLKETPIKSVQGMTVDGESGRYLIDSLELWDGTKVFFGASPQGAVIYRVAPPTSYADEK